MTKTRTATEGWGRRFFARRRFPVLLAVVLGCGFLLRVLYHLAQGAHDPFAAHPFLDGEVYFEWAKAIRAGTGEGGGAFYLAPLYPYLLAALFAVTGPKLVAVYLVQHVLSVTSAGLAAWIARRRFGVAAALATAFLFVFHQPLVFFAATPMGETVALTLLLASLVAAGGESRFHAAASGVLGGLAALARPNLLLVPVFLFFGELRARRWWRAGLLAAATALVVLPVTVRNWVASGHPVLISSNGGLTLYHGNAPGAEGVFVRPEGFSAVVSRQREEATAIARLRSADATLDAVEADRWWGAEARRARLADLGGTVVLLARKAMLLCDDFEHALDYDPMLDANPWRPTLRFGVDPARPGSGFEVAVVPFAALFGLALAALALFGPRRSGGWAVWGPVLACAATPLIFYVSSRYRLATSALLTIPAGLGAAGLVGLHGAPSATRRRVGLLVLGGAAAFSFLVPSGDLARRGRAFGLSNRAGVLMLAEDWAAAERYARMAIEEGPGVSAAYHNLAYLLTRTGRPAEAIAAYEEAVRRDPGNADSAGNLARLLVDAGRAAEAEPLLRRALARRPSHAGCWTALVYVLAALDRRPEAEAALREAARHGVRVDPRVLRGG